MIPSVHRSPGAPDPWLARLEAWPFLRIERRGGAAVLYFCDGGRAIGTIDVRTGMLTVDVDPALVGPLLARDAQLHAAPGGVRLRAAGAGRSAAEALLRWRIDLERYAPQLRDASP
jgi:hypothetical protein